MMNINDESLLIYGSNTKGSGRDLTNMQQVFVQLEALANVK